MRRAIMRRAGRDAGGRRISRRPGAQGAPHPVTLWFIRDPREYQDGLRRMRGLAGKTKLWIAWPKGVKNGLKSNVVREIAIEAGLVDYKICALGERWSGMVFALKRQ